MILDDLTAIGEAGMRAAKMTGIGKKKTEDIIVGMGTGKMKTEEIIVGQVVIGMGGIVMIEEIQIGELIMAVGIIIEEMA